MYYTCAGCGHSSRYSQDNPTLACPKCGTPISTTSGTELTGEMIAAMPTVQDESAWGDYSDSKWNPSTDPTTQSYLPPGQGPPLALEGSLFSQDASLASASMEGLSPGAENELAKIFADEDAGSGMMSAVIICAFIMVLGLAIAYQFAFITTVRKLTAEKVAEGMAGGDWVFEMQCKKARYCSGPVGRCKGRPEERLCFIIENNGKAPIPPSVIQHMSMDFHKVKEGINEVEIIPFTDVWLLEEEECHRLPECDGCKSIGTGKTFTIMVPTDFVANDLGEMFYEQETAKVKPRAEMTKVGPPCTVRFEYL
ncbi:MAG: hypothetical protein QGG50_07175 [Methanopyri archaeon]|nr:hypothetical protein [Methanopyri archaeon]